MLGQYVLQMTEKTPNIDMPGDIRRLVQNVSSIETQRKLKPIFTDRKIGKSMSVNSQLGFPLKVLEELNESMESPVAQHKHKSPFFENTYQQIRDQNRMRPTRLDAATAISADIKLPKHVEKALENLTKSPAEADSGIATPLSPPILGAVIPSSSSTLAVSSPAVIPEEHSEIPVIVEPGMHPLSNCEDVNFKFNGTTQLRSLRPNIYQNRPVNQDASKPGRS